MIDNWLRTYGLPMTLRELIDPVVRSLSPHDPAAGQKEISLTQSYALGAIIDQAFSPFAESVESQVSPYTKKGRIVLGNVEGDFHALGRKIVATMARMHHWEVIDLGTNVLAGEFVDAAVERQATIIGVSAMTYTNAKKIPAVRQMLNQNHLEEQIRLAVGGAVFALDPQLAQEVGADGTASGALESIELFDQLRQNHISTQKGLQPRIPKFATVDYLSEDHQSVLPHSPLYY